MVTVRLKSLAAFLINLTFAQGHKAAQDRIPLTARSNGESEVCLATFSENLPAWDRLVGLVVKASASRAEYPGFESRLRRDFSGVESYQ